MPAPGCKLQYMTDTELHGWNFSPYEHGKRFNHHTPTRHFCDVVRFHGFISIPDLKMNGLPWAFNVPLGHTIYNSRPCREAGHASEFIYELACGSKPEHSFYHRIMDELETQLSATIGYKNLENATKGISNHIMPDSLEPDVAAMYPEGYPIFRRYRVPQNILKSNSVASLAFAKVVDIRIHITFLGEYNLQSRTLALFTDHASRNHEYADSMPKPKVAKTLGKQGNAKERPPPASPQPSGSGNKPRSEDTSNSDRADRKKRGRTPSRSTECSSRDSSTSSIRSTHSTSTQAYQERVVNNRPPTPGTLQLLHEEANAPLALHVRRSEERDLLKSSEKEKERPRTDPKNPNRQDPRATIHMANREDTRRHEEKKAKTDASLPRKSQRDKSEPTAPAKETSTSSDKVSRRPIPHSISHIFKTLSVADQDAMLKLVYKEGN